MEIKVYHHLPDEAIAIRQSVFVEEQGFQNEFDDIDQQATHLVLFQDRQPAATCRFFYSDARQCHLIGRVAVLKQYRGKNYGAALLQAAEQTILQNGGTKAMLSAQCKVSEFYRKQGYQEQGTPYHDEHCLHIWMEKSLSVDCSG